MWLTRLPVEEEIYRKALAQARLTAHQLANKGTLQNSETLLKALRQVEHDLSGIKECDVFVHDPEHHLLASTNPQGEHFELDHLPNVENYNEFERPNDEQIAIETPDDSFWVIGTTIYDQRQAVGCLNFKVSKSRLNAVTWDLVLRNLMLMLASLAVSTRYHI